MEFIYYGHSCFQIELGGKKLLFDPFITPNPLSQSISLDSIEADYILLSHGHADHVADLVPIAQRTGAMVIANFEISEWAKAQGIEQVHGMNFGSTNFDFGKLVMVPASHSSSLPDGSYGGQPGGYIIQTDGFGFYFAGDTGLIRDMELIPLYGPIDLAVLPIGGNFTMDVEDAARAADFIQCRRVVGVHFDTFPPIKINSQAAIEHFASKEKELIVPKIGERLNFDR